jgi:hypothetical protein
MGDLTTNEAATLIISSLSFVASVIGMIVAVRANAKTNAISLQANRIALLQAQESSHGRLAENLSTVEHRLEKPLKELSETANLALIAITKSIGKYDHRESNEKRLRHVFYQSCTSVSSVLSKQIVWQTGACLYRRLDAIRKSDGVTEEGGSIQSELDFAMYYGPVHRRRGILRLLSPKVPVDSAELETELKEIYRNINEQDAARLLVEAHDLCGRYVKLVEDLRPLIASVLEELSAAARLNKYQRFKLEQSNDLHREYTRMVSKLEFLQECDLDAVKSTGTQSVYNPISQLLYVGIVLTIVTENYWGL